MGQSTMSKGGDHTMIGLFLIGSMCEVRVRDLRPLTTSSHPVDASRKHMDLIIKLGCDRFVRVFPCGCHGYENYPTILDNITPSYSV